MASNDNDDKNPVPEPEEGIEEIVSDPAKDSGDPFRPFEPESDEENNETNENPDTNGIREESSDKIPIYHMRLDTNYMFLGQKLFYDLVQAAGEIDSNDMIFIKRVMGEFIPGISGRELADMERSYQQFNNGEYASEMYSRFFEFFMNIEVERDNPEFTERHENLVQKILPFFNIVTEEQRKMVDIYMKRMKGEGEEAVPGEIVDDAEPVDDIDLIEIKDATEYLGQGVAFLLNPKVCMSRTILKNFIWMCYTNDIKEGNDAEIDNIERRILNNFAKQLFGIDPEQIYEIKEEMKREDARIKVFSYSLNALKEDHTAQDILSGKINRESAEFRARIKDNIEAFIRCIKHANIDGIVTERRKGFLREIGRYFGIREEDTYQRLVENSTNKKMRVAVINGEKLESQIYQQSLNSSAYEIMFVNAENMRKTGVFEDLRPDVVVVDASTDYGRTLARAIADTYPQISVYTVMDPKSLKHGQEQEMTETLNKSLRAGAKGKIKGTFCYQRVSDVKDALRDEYIQRSVR